MADAPGQGYWARFWRHFKKDWTAAVKSQLLTALVCLLVTLGLQYHFGMIAGPQLKVNAISLVTPYLLIAFLFAIYHAVHAMVLIHREDQALIADLRSGQQIPRPTSKTQPSQSRPNLECKPPRRERLVLLDTNMWIKPVDLVGHPSRIQVSGDALTIEVVNIAQFGKDAAAVESVQAQLTWYVGGREFSAASPAPWVSQTYNSADFCSADPQIIVAAFAKEGTDDWSVITHRRNSSDQELSWNSMSPLAAPRENARVELKLVHLNAAMHVLSTVMYDWIWKDRYSPELIPKRR